MVINRSQGSRKVLLFLSTFFTGLAFSVYVCAQQSPPVPKSTPVAQHESPQAREIEQLLNRSVATVYETDGRKRFHRVTFTNEQVAFEPPCHLSYELIGTEASNEGPSRTLTQVEIDLAKVDVSKARLSRYSELQNPTAGLHYTMDGWTVEFIDADGKSAGTLNFSSEARGRAFLASLAKAAQSCAVTK